MATRIHFINIYSLYDDGDAGIIENLLSDYNITCMVKLFDARTGDATGDTDTLTLKRISVEEDGVTNARQVINDAIKNGIISNNGHFEA